MGEKGLVYTGSSKLMIKFVLTELLNSYLNALGSQSQMIVLRYQSLLLSELLGCNLQLVLCAIVTLKNDKEIRISPSASCFNIEYNDFAWSAMGRAAGATWS